MVYSCEAVSNVACGAHLGVSTTLHAHPEEVMAWVPKKPKTLDAAINRFKGTGQFIDDKYAKIPSWNEAKARTHQAAISNTRCIKIYRIVGLRLNLIP